MEIDGKTVEIRREFYALRNGILADTLRKAGMNLKYIFGLQLPQIKTIADRFRSDDAGENAALARNLWTDKDCRESRLLACHLMPPSEITREEAEAWTHGITTREEADILAFRLIRHLGYAGELSEKLEKSDDNLLNYEAVAIRRFID